MIFSQISSEAVGLRDPRSDEPLIELAARQGPVAGIWEAAQGLVVPRTYRRFSGFPEACAQLAIRGWPITVRLSGGGIVPQGPGIINLSLAYAAEGKPLDASDQAYLLICDIISQALLPFGISSHPAAVQGSFCDGRYNLAVGAGDTLRKVAGTAQLWRRVSLPGHESAQTQVVMVHALILAHVDIEDVTARANLFEQMLGSGKRYEADKAASLFDLCKAPGYSPDSFLDALKASLTQCISTASILSPTPLS